MVEAALAAGAIDEHDHDRRHGEDHARAPGAAGGRSMCASRRWRRSATTASRRCASMRSPRRPSGSAGRPSGSLVIDADLGVSGRGGSARDGFKELVGRVCCGEVGAVFGLEVSRLARSQRGSAAAAGAVQPDRHADRRRRRHLRPRPVQRPAAARPEGHDVRGRAAPARPAGCRAPGAPPPSAASCASRCPVGYVYDDDGEIVDGPRRGGPRRGR